MLFLRITEQHPYLTTIRSWYEGSFPPDERRSFDQLTAFLPCPEIHLCALVNDGQLVGF